MCANKHSYEFHIPRSSNLVADSHRKATYNYYKYLILVVSYNFNILTIVYNVDARFHSYGAVYLGLDKVSSVLFQTFFQPYRISRY